MNMRLSTYIVRVRQRNSQRTITNSLSPDSLYPNFFRWKKVCVFTSKTLPICYEPFLKAIRTLRTSLPYKVLYVASMLRIFSINLIEPGEQWWTEVPQCLYVIVTMMLSQHPSTISPQCHALNTTSGTSCLQCYPPHWSHWFSPVASPTNQRDVPP